MDGWMARSEWIWMTAVRGGVCECALYGGCYMPPQSAVRM